MSKRRVVIIGADNSEHLNEIKAQLGNDIEVVDPEGIVDMSEIEQTIVIRSKPELPDMCRNEYLRKRDFKEPKTRMSKKERRMHRK